MNDKMTDMPQRIWAKPHTGYCTANKPREADIKRLNITEYIRADLVAAKDEEISRLRKELADGSFYKESDIDALVDRAKTAEAEISRLRGLLKGRDDGKHGKKCMLAHSMRGTCTCHHDAVAAYFREIEG